jgi:N-acetylglucosamine kinase-like BadF-type ATPase
MTITIGADAGGTATTVAIWRDGAELARVTGGAGAVRPGRAMVAAAAIADAIRVALARAGLQRGDLLVVGAAGAGRDTERQELRTAIRMHDLAERLVVTTDVELALAAAFGGEPGIILIAGTGSIAVARGKDGTLRRAGGFGWQMGDEGGGYWIGRMAIQAVGRASDDRGGSTSLLAEVGPIVRCTTLEELVRWSLTAAPSEVAALAPGVARAAEQGDGMATAILDRAAEELAGLVGSAARDGGEGLPVAVSGGLLGAAGPLRERVLERLSAFAVEAGPLDPVRGAMAPPP